METSQEIRFEPIAVMRSPFEEKFAVPRQSGLVPAATGEVVFLPPFDDPAMLQGLRGFSHIWLTFVFDRCVDQGWRAKVRPPRLGGNREVGVWASRSPFRPNFLGLSAVRLLDVVSGPPPRLRVSGVDLLDGTPILDIKPYLPYADAITDAVGGFAPAAPVSPLPVTFSARAEATLAQIDDGASLRSLISGVLALDPRPAYRRGAEPDRVYGVHLAGRNVRWVVGEAGLQVLDLDPVDPD